MYVLSLSQCLCVSARSNARSLSIEKLLLTKLNVVVFTGYRELEESVSMVLVLKTRALPVSFC